MIDEFKNVKNVHFIGIGGIGVSAIARMFLAEGKKVSGSDVVESEITKALGKLGAKIFIGQKSENLPKNTDLVIYTIAITKENPEFAEAVKRKIPKKSYPEILEIVSKNKYTIAVAGTHGKTTTTAMIAKILMDSGKDPMVIVGSLLDADKMRNERGQMRTNFISGRSKYLVVEACEYRRSFLHIHPTILVITNIDNDHLDYYKDLKSIQKAFSEFVAKVPKNGYLVTNVTDKIIRPAIKSAKCKVVDYAQFKVDNLKLKVYGSHNRMNAEAGLAVAHILEIDNKKAKSSLEGFSGTWRRFDFKGKTKGGALVYDDYGHHPTEIGATLYGAREAFPDKKITLVFQPHLYSRTKEHFDEFVKVLAHADSIILAPIYGAREVFDASVSSQKLAEKVSTRNKNVHYIEKFEDIVIELNKTKNKKDLILVTGAGNINEVSEKLVHKVKSL